MTTPDPRRPRDLALLLLAIGVGPPRGRARDQQADVAGAALFEKVLDRVAAVDPEPDALEATLAAVVAEFGEPTGPTRGIAVQFLRDWNDLGLSPGAWEWLLSEAVERSAFADGNGRRRRGPA